MLEDDKEIVDRRQYEQMPRNVPNKIKNDNNNITQNILAMIGIIGLIGSMIIYWKTNLDEFSDLQYRVTSIKEHDLTLLQNSMNSNKKEIISKIDVMFVSSRKNSQAIELLKSDVDFIVRNYQQLAEINTRLDNLELRIYK